MFVINACVYNSVLGIPTFEHVCKHIHMCQGQHQISVVFLYYSLLYFLTQNPLLYLNLSIWLVWLDSSREPLFFSDYRIINACHITFYISARDLIYCLLLEWQAIYQLNNIIYPQSTCFLNTSTLI